MKQSQEAKEVINGYHRDERRVTMGKGVKKLRVRRWARRWRQDRYESKGGESQRGELRERRRDRRDVTRGARKGKTR